MCSYFRVDDGNDRDERKWRSILFGIRADQPNSHRPAQWPFMIWPDVLSDSVITCLRQDDGLPTFTALAVSIIAWLSIL